MAIGLCQWPVPAGSVVTALGDDEIALPAPQVRFALGLRSTWFTVGLLSLARPVGPAVYGVPLTVVANVRGVARATLEQRSPPGPWAPGPPLGPPAADGTFSLLLRPLETVELRLSAPAIAGPVLRVPVGPQVSLDLQPDGSGVRGRVAPSIAGTAVEIQRSVAGGWITIATARVDAAGGYAVATAVQPGSYRALVAGIPGLVAAASPPLEVTA
jgi:hypothetical protein